MRLIRFVTLILVVAAATPAYAVKQGDVAPRWQGVDFRGQTVQFPEVAGGKPTVLVFWATWCSYCKAFMPYLAQIQSDYGADRIAIVAVNAKEKDGDPKSYIEALDFPMTAIRDGDDIAAAYAVKFIPGLMVIDGQGVVAYRRPWTDLPAGRTVAELWSDQVREVLDRVL